MNKKLLFARGLLILTLMVSAVVATYAGYALWQRSQIDGFTADPGAYDVVPDDPRAHFAKALHLEMDDEHDQALEYFTGVLGGDDSSLLALAYYNRGNISLREALNMTISDGRQIPLVELAKQDYRSALALDSMLWDARFNLEVALSIVPEDPDTASEFEKNIIDSERSIESKAFKVDLP